MSGGGSSDQVQCCSTVVAPRSSKLRYSTSSGDPHCEEPGEPKASSGLLISRSRDHLPAADHRHGLHPARVVAVTDSTTPRAVSCTVCWCRPGCDWRTVSPSQTDCPLSEELRPGDDLTPAVHFHERVLCHAGDRHRLRITMTAFNHHHDLIKADVFSEHHALARSCRACI